MSLASEAVDAKPPLAAGLAEGIETLSLDQEVTFTKYVKLVMPLDGFVYWVKTGLTEANPTEITTTVKGSLHYATDQSQHEDETFGRNRMVFTALREIDDFNVVSSQELWIAEFDGLKFAFSTRGYLYKQADLYHYAGDAIFPSMSSQVVTTEDELEALTLVVTNSLPIWLTLTMEDTLPIYPSYLVSPNIAPPFAAVHIDPARTEVYTAAPILNATMSRAALASDAVRVTFYGYTNAQALDWLDYVLAYMADGDNLGLQNMPTVRDEKRTQDELSVIAMKKTIEFKVSYLQSTSRNIARQLILSCIPTITVQ